MNYSDEKNNMTDCADNGALLEAVLNDSNQMVQVSDIETFSMMYANTPARKYTGHSDMPYEGEHCYKYMMGLDEQCPFCPMRKMSGKDCEETEVDNGNQVFAVKTKLIDWNGKKAFIEYAWDITELRRSQKIFESQIETLIRSVPNAEGIFHLDVTADRCINISGRSDNARTIYSDSLSINDAVRGITKFIPSEKEREKFFGIFCREALLRAYDEGNVQITEEASSLFDDGNIKTARITARLIMNPTTDHLECIIYGIDVSSEQLELMKYKSDLKEQFDIFNALSKDYLDIYLIDDTAENARILKLEGYVTTGLDKQSTKSFPYYETCKRYISERVHPDDKEMMLECMKPERVLAELEKNKEYVTTYKTLTDDETHYYQFKYIRLESTKYIIAGFQNIDSIIANEKEQHRLLADALAKAEDSNRAKTTFLNSISHDIRTPLNAIIGFTALAASHVENKDDIQNYLAKINTSSNHLLSLINDVLDMSHIESGKIRIDEAPIHLSDVLNDVRMIILPNISAKQLDLFLDTQDVVDEDIIADKLRLNQVLLNILSNAIKFTKPGGSIRFLIVQLKDAPEGFAKYEFHISDTGIGMSEEFMRHIFEPFTREQTSTISGIQGTGLGMSIAKNIVDIMGGNISVQSEVGKGTEFTVTLQFKTCAASYKIDYIPELKGTRALVADDDFNTCASITKMLDSIGMRSEWTTTGKEAVLRTKLAIEMNDEFNVYIIDWLMPDMNGIETVRRIRQIIGKSKPIIILTAYDWTEMEAEAREAGVIAFCSKPIFMSELREILSKPYRVEPEESSEPDKDIFSGKKLLLVEDNELNMEIAVEILREAGFTVDTADDGTTAVEIMSHAAPDQYDLILMDIQMPKMNGFEATKQIRRMPDHRIADIPIIAMTANAFEEDRRNAINAGMNGHIAKPIDIQKLMDTLKDILSGK